MKLNKQYCRDIKDVHFFDLESPSITLPKLSGLIVMDEIQRPPRFIVYLRFLVDNSDLKRLILGSASQALRPSKSRWSLFQEYLAGDGEKGLSALLL